MDKIKDFFDDFTFHARVMPVLTSMLPLVIVGITKGWIGKDVFDFTLYIFLILVILTFFSKIARELGKKYEKKLYRDLGAMPTTIVLRFSDTTIDNITKIRYHQVLSNTLNLKNFPMNVEDEEKNDKSDEFYISSMTHLRNRANANRKLETRVYQELKEYNYWRNLYGFKWITLFIYVFVAVREVIIKESFDVKEIFMQPYPEYVAFIFMIIGIIMLVFCVKKSVVREKAFDYAKTLAETCERIK